MNDLGGNPPSTGITYLHSFLQSPPDTGSSLKSVVVHQEFQLLGIEGIRNFGMLTIELIYQLHSGSLLLLNPLTRRVHAW